MLLVYYPMAHMVWGQGGLIAGFGAVDFAGGFVIEISSGISGLVACIILGSRKGYGIKSYHPHNIPLFVIGGAILWVGWFAFNGGSALAANGLAVHAVATTLLASAAAMLTWMLVEMVVYKKVTVMWCHYRFDRRLGFHYARSWFCTDRSGFVYRRCGESNLLFLFNKGEG